MAAPITRHPHNELLHVASQIGVFGAFLWVLTAGIVLCRPPRRTAFWYAVHFTAFIIVGQAMFDKQLVQPPVNLVGYFMVGLLWRPRLRLRLDPSRRPWWLRRLALPVGAGVAVYGVFTSWEDLRADIWLREGQLQEFKGKKQVAYYCYRQAAQIEKRNVRTQMIAGIAANKVRKPREALNHLRRVYVREPAYAHVNGQLGLALGRLNQHEKARKFFHVDAKLFPFDTSVYHKIYIASIASGHTADLGKIISEMKALWHRNAVQSLGRQQLAIARMRWALALKEGNIEQCLRSARRMTSGLFASGADPAFRRAVSKVSMPRRFTGEFFLPSDVFYWQRQWIWNEQVWDRSNNAGLKTLLKNFENTWKRRLGSRNAREDGKGPFATLHGGDKAWALAECAQQGGTAAAIVRTANGDSTGTVQLYHSGEWFLVNVQRRVVYRNRSVYDLFSDASLAQDLGAEKIHRDGSAELALVCSPFDYCVRTQALAGAVEVRESVSLPRFGIPPGLRQHRWEKRLAKLSQDNGPEKGVTVKGDRVDLVHDMRMFSRIASTWGRQWWQYQHEKQRRLRTDRQGLD